MLHIKKTTRFKNMIAMVAIAFSPILYSGCNPQNGVSSPTGSSKVADTDSADLTDESTPHSTAIESETPKQLTDEAESPKVMTSSKSEAILIEDLGAVDWASLLGKKVTIPGELVVVDNYDLARRGQVVVARQLVFVPTSHIDPNDSDPSAVSFEGGSNVARVVEAQKVNDRATIILDDGLDDQNIFPPTLFPNLGKTHPSVRVGSTIKGVSGRLTKERKNIVLVPNTPLQWTPVQRPARPDVGAANVTVASFNVLNYFTTIDDGKNGARGADTRIELERQESKIVSAIVALEADVIGLMEIENNLDAEKRLVAALNEKVGENVFKACSLPDGFADAPGGQNAIRVGIIYRADRVEPTGKVSMINDIAFTGARTPVVQTFKSNPTNGSGQPFAVVVNHFKSKGGSGADKANKNKGDGQGAFNATRRSQALAICNYIDKLKGDGDPRVLVIGDLNAYEQEDPIDALRAKGLIDLQKRFGNSDVVRDYSYVYRGQCGSLDHAMATEALAKDITGIKTWHINADEPRFLDYNEEYNPKTLFKADPFRSSDHDPVLIGIRN